MFSTVNVAVGGYFLTVAALGGKKTHLPSINPAWFYRIEPNEARVAVPDDRYDWLVNHWKPASAVSAFLTVYFVLIKHSFAFRFNSLFSTAIR
jgi:hypothetical protein